MCWGFAGARWLSFAPVFAVWFELAAGLSEGVRRIGHWAVWRRGVIYGVDADEVDPEVPQLVEEPVELGLVGEVPSERGLAWLGVEFELAERVGEVFAEPPADDDPVAHVVAGLVFHGRYRRTGTDERSPPCEPVHPG